MKFSIKDFFGKCYQIRWKLPIWSHLLKKSLMENFIFGAVIVHIPLAHFTSYHHYYQFNSTLFLKNYFT